MQRASHAIPCVSPNVEMLAELTGRQGGISGQEMLNGELPI
jgi:hypothetical protein